MDKKKIYRSIIMDNYKNPSRFSKKDPEGYQHATSKSKTCLDHFEVFVSIKNDIIQDIVFNGEGCSVSTSTLNLVSTYLIDLPTSEAMVFISKYKKFIKEGKTENFEPKDLVAFENVHIHLNRVVCALIGTNSILQILKAHSD